MRTFQQQILKESGQNVSRCLQCLKCASGCPMIDWADFRPNQINRMIQFDQKERIFASSIIWLCVGCQICVTRCPMELDMPRIMDTLRRFAISEDYKLKEKNILLFHRLFLESLKRWGRVHELELIGLYKLKSKNLIQDLRLGVQMFLKGKLSIFPQTNKDRKSIREIFERCMQKR